ncbi:MAG: hypothetical protein JXB23_12910 [Candidatus Aminicenantes bacterium]|nr:hypothetical protein [Candidatus Aminicenantes bacterium]
MEIHDILKKIERVEAPHDFERRIMRELSVKKAGKAKTNRLRLSFAASVSAAAVMLLVVGLFFLPQREPVAATSLDKGGTPLPRRGFQRGDGMVVPIIEAVDYAGEFRRVSDQPPTIYILEHVSDSTDTKTRY